MKSGYWVIASVLLMLALLGPLQAQNSPDGVNKLTLTLQGADLQKAAGVIHIQDTLANGLAVESVTVNGEALWLKKENTPPTRNGVVHFWFDKQQLQLTLYFPTANLVDWQNARIQIVVVGVGGTVHSGVVVRGSNGETLNP